MNPSVFRLSRLEFRRFDIEANPEYILPEQPAVFPQIDFEFNKVQIELGTDLAYPDDELEDPRHFTLSLKLSIQQSKQVDGVILPYSITIEGTAYLNFRGKDEGLRRFQVVRGTGYLMVYSAFREHIANFTARSVHGLWFLPTPNFNSRVEADAPIDFEKWEAAIAAKIAKSKPKATKVARKKAPDASEEQISKQKM
ncbi:hypothetical protein [Massilia sp. IC2-476]|uniref:hypothetical protein n=1 Tax=Massilia sp. IC2-476 TaxID=2887199 RepID=UPI001D0F796F|nr:hypothetical protein [Massilia sp. IC2-476]MCC2971285.1 hypothetical protein [Massilia sp. IC2-476]